jgi:hypothetical protein
MLVFHNTSEERIEASKKPMPQCVSSMSATVPYSWDWRFGDFRMSVVVTPTARTIARTTNVIELETEKKICVSRRSLIIAYSPLLSFSTMMRCQRQPKPQSLTEGTADKSETDYINTMTFSIPRIHSTFVLLLLVLVGILEIPVCHGWSLQGRDSSSNAGTTRRDFVQAGAPLVSVGWLLSQGTDALAASSDASSSSNLPFCVIGANGRTGTKCVSQLLQANLPVRATSRSGIYDDMPTDSSTSTPMLQSMVCDVTQPATVDEVVRGSRAVLFAASASKQGGTPAQVDKEGLVAVAKACIANQVPHLVVVSSGGVSQPNSSIYKFLNLFGGIMEQKIEGEEVVRNLYAQQEDTVDGKVRLPTFTIIRPGGLTEEPGLGPAALELCQGDVKSGRISRNDVASLCIQSTYYPQWTGGTTFECYNADTGKEVGQVGFSNLTKQKNDPATSLATGRERRGDTWERLFTGLEKA